MENPHMQEQVLEVLDKLRPFLLRDGGDVELVDIEEGIVKLRLMGACGSCPSSTITLKAGIERALLEEVPGVIEVEQVFNLKAEAARSEQEVIGAPDEEALFASQEGAKWPTVLAAGAGY